MANSNRVSNLHFRSINSTQFSSPFLMATPPKPHYKQLIEAKMVAKQADEPPQELMGHSLMDQNLYDIEPS
ncbi:hypothetical protein CR513_58510, partial [Mucuna pruriens]